LELKSPNGAIIVSLKITDEVRYSVSCNADELFTNNSMALELKNDVLGSSPKLLSAKASAGNSIIKPYISLKYSTVTSIYNKLVLTFKGNYAVEFRVFNSGIAFRFITSKKGDIEVLNEQVDLDFPANYDLHVQQPGGFETAYAENYLTVSSADWNTKMST